MGRKPIRHGTQPSFFKVLLGDFSKQLKIPTEFIKHVNGKLPGNFKLQSPTGTYWSVKVKKIKDGWFFRKGWNRFVEYHSLELGEFLVFTYKGNSQFRVTIFDRSACEKKLPLAKKRRKDHEEEEHSNSQIKPQKPGSKAIITKLTKKSVKPLVKKRKGRNTYKIKINGRYQSVHLLETDRPHLTQIWKPSMRHQITVPKALAEETGLVGKERILLWDPEGRSWPVKLSSRIDGRLLLRTGWPEFWKGHNLVRGDACVFEFLQKGRGDDDEISICVHIFRAAAENLQPISSDLMPLTTTMATAMVEMSTYDNDGETRELASPGLQEVQLLE